MRTEDSVVDIFSGTRKHSTPRSAECDGTIRTTIQAHQRRRTWRPFTQQRILTRAFAAAAIRAPVDPAKPHTGHHYSREHSPGWRICSLPAGKTAVWCEIATTQPSMMGRLLRVQYQNPTGASGTTQNAVLSRADFPHIWPVDPASAVRGPAGRIPPCQLSQRSEPAVQVCNSKLNGHKLSASFPGPGRRLSRVTRGPRIALRDSVAAG